MSKYLFYCNDPIALISKIKDLQNIKDETENIIQGNTGQDWLKIGINIIKKNDLKRQQMERISAAGTELETDKDTESGPSQKRIKRRIKGNLTLH